MSCSPTDLLGLANSIGASPGCSEVELRCATSRGYYAALHTVDETIPVIEGVERQRNEGSHAFVIRRTLKYGDGPNPGRLEAKKIAIAMKKLKDQRNDADYHLDMGYASRDKDDALARVGVILGYCSALRSAIESRAADFADAEAPTLRRTR